jgi:hypothetical protein
LLPETVLDIQAVACDSRDEFVCQNNEVDLEIDVHIHSFICNVLNFVVTSSFSLIRVVYRKIKGLHA